MLESDDISALLGALSSQPPNKTTTLDPSHASLMTPVSDNQLCGPVGSRSVGHGPEASDSASCHLRSSSGEAGMSDTPKPSELHSRQTLSDVPRPSQAPGSLNRAAVSSAGSDMGKWACIQELSAQCSWLLVISF